MTSAWIRGPAWDGCWVLSGLAFGAALTALSARVPGPVIVLWLVLLTQTGHLLAPMALAWRHDRLRPLMLRRRVKYIAIPAAVVAAATATGAIAGRHLHLRFDPVSFAIGVPSDWRGFANPFMAMVALYVAWNAFHFGKQAFGVLSIYRMKQGGYGAHQRRIDLVYACVVVWAAMAMPFIPSLAHGAHDLSGWPAGPHPFLDRVPFAYLGFAAAATMPMLIREWCAGRSLPRTILILADGAALALIWCAGLWGLAILALNHWLVAIGLASHVHARGTRGSPWPFAIAVMAAGCAVFGALFIDPREMLSRGVEGALYFTTAAVGFRIGLGFVHFLYDRWIWKFGDPMVRATIGEAFLTE
jgi:hypothetical protein